MGVIVSLEITDDGEFLGSSKKVVLCGSKRTRTEVYNRCTRSHHTFALTVIGEAAIWILVVMVGMIVVACWMSYCLLRSIERVAEFLQYAR